MPVRHTHVPNYHLALASHRYSRSSFVIAIFPMSIRSRSIGDCSHERWIFNPPSGFDRSTGSEHSRKPTGRTESDERTAHVPPSYRGNCCRLGNLDEGLRKTGTRPTRGWLDVIFSSVRENGRRRTGQKCLRCEIAIVPTNYCTSNRASLRRKRPLDPLSASGCAIKILVSQECRFPPHENPPVMLICVIYLSP